MSAPRDPEGGAERERFVALLDEAAERGRTIPFWWRDDDAVAVTPALRRLLGLARHHDLPLALAVIPKGVAPDLAEALAAEPLVAVLQHGWQHKNHSPPDQKRMELGDHRPLAVILEELSLGFDRLGLLLAQKFLPVLVPPWNRISDAVRAARRDVGLAGISGYGPAPPGEAHAAYTHVDIIDWRTRGPLPRAEAYVLLSGEIERRLAGDDEPIGILTHHLVHQEGSWEFLDELLSVTARHPATAWPSAATLFDLSPRSQS